MSDAMKRSRKCKLVPRHEEDDDNTTAVEMEENPPKVPKIKLEVCDPETENAVIAPSLQFSIKVEVEEVPEYNKTEEHDITENINEDEVEDEQSTSNSSGDDNQTMENYKNDPNYNPKAREKHRKSLRQKEQTNVTVEGINFENVRFEINKLRNLTGTAENILNIASRNMLGIFSQPTKHSPQEKMLQKVIVAWRNWITFKPRQEPLSYKCYICNIAWWHLFDFREHIESHNEKDINVYMETFNHDCNIVCTLGEKQEIIIDIPLDGKCWKCNKTYDMHLRRKTHPMPSYTCTGCVKTFLTCSVLRDHERFCEPYLKLRYKDLETAFKLFECRLCTMLCDSQEDLNEHMVLSHCVRSDIPLAAKTKHCSTCEKDYIYYPLHNCSRKISHNVCEFCSLHFPTRFFEGLHKRNNKDPYMCKICHKRLPRQCMKAEHMVEHSQLFVIAYKCQYCPDAIFSSEYGIREHRSSVHATKRIPNYKIYQLIVVPKSCFNVTPDTSKSSLDLKKYFNDVDDEPLFEKPTILAKYKTEDFQKSLQQECEKLEKDDLSMSSDVIIKTEKDIKQETVDEEEMEGAQDYEEILSNVFKVSKVINTKPRPEEMVMEELDIKEEPIDEYEHDMIVLHNREEYENLFEQEPSGIQEDMNIEEVNIKQEIKKDEESFCSDESMNLITEPEVIIKTKKKKHNKNYKTKKSLKLAKSEKYQIQSTFYKCTKCNTKFPDMKEYVKHLPGHALERLACPQCNVLCETPDVERKEYNADAPSKKMYQCTKCKEKMTSSKFFAHWESHLDFQDIKKELQDIDYEIALVQAESLSPDVTKEVIEQLTTVRKNTLEMRSILKTCCVCLRQFDRQNDCKRHLIEHLLQDAYINKYTYGHLKCQICNEGFHKAETYKRHMRDHGALPIFFCQMCNKNFSDSSNFTKHKKIHNLLVLICDICKKRFQAKVSLEKHMEVHKTTKMIKCPKCPKVFYEHSLYKKHYRNHNKMNVTVRCVICKAKFASLREKWDHLWEVHKERNYKADCPVCQLPFRKFQDVKKHVRTFHDRNITLVNPAKMNRHEQSGENSNKTGSGVIKREENAVYIEEI